MLRGASRRSESIVLPVPTTNLLPHSIMPGLSVTEKEHWKNRIAHRIDCRIDRLWAEEPNLQEQINRQARQQAIASLGLAELRAELDEITREEEVHERRRTEIGKRMLALVRRSAVEDVRDYHAYQNDREIDAAIERRQEVLSDELLGKTPLGQRILRLRAEKETLLDTVWLATSPAAIKTLWEKVSHLLGDEMTTLEREALAIAPDDVPRP